MNYIVFCPILFFISLAEFTQSASLQDLLEFIDSSDFTKYIENYNFGDYNIVLGDIMESIPLRLSATPDKQKLWNPKEPIPVYVQQSFPKSMKDAIEIALNDIQKNTCLRFKNAMHGDNQTGVLVYTDGLGCYSRLGYQGGLQQIVMRSDGCDCAGIAIHETLHALGFYHEQNRSDRDDYITVNYTNLQEGVESQFIKLSPDQNRLLTEYDYDSIMHYEDDAFSKSPGLKTIQPKKEGVKLLHSCTKGKLSKLDIVKINKLYNCIFYLDETVNPGKGVKNFVLRRS